MDFVKGNNVIIKDDVAIGNNVVLEDDVYLDCGAVIRDNVHIKKGTYIGAKCIIGEYTKDYYIDRVVKKHPLSIGKDSIIRSDSIIYGDSTIGDNFITGHRVTIREESIIGEHVRVGTNTDIQGRCSIGNYTSIHSGCFICEYTKIGNYVWIFPNVTITNDLLPPSNKVSSVEIKDFAVICAKSILLPGIKVGYNSMVCAASVVSKDVNEKTVVMGQPARFKCSIEENKSENSIMPWMESFDRGMPWENSNFKKWIINNK